MRRIFLLSSTLVGLYFFTACTPPAKPEAADKGGTDGSAGGESAAAIGDGLPALPTGAVAIVNGTEITAADFHAIYDLKLQKYKDREREIPKTADRRYRKSITDRLIYNEVLRQEAVAVGKDYDPAALAEREEAQKKGITEWDRHLARRGESDTSLREMYIAELREVALLEQRGALTVTPEEIAEDYEKVKPNYKSDQERVRAAHILVRIGPAERSARPPDPKKELTAEEKAQEETWKQEALARANEIYARASVPGTDFEALATEVSDGPSARKGGDLGIFSADRMVDEFSKAAFALKSGEVSKPIETKFGYHIIKSYGKYPPGDLPREALEGQIRERLESRKLHQGRRDLKEELLAKYKVENIMEKHLGPDPRKEKLEKDRDAKRFKGQHHGDAAPGAGRGTKPVGDGQGPEGEGDAKSEGAGEGGKSGEVDSKGDAKRSGGGDAKGEGGKQGEGDKKGGGGKKGEGGKKGGKEGEGGKSAAGGGE